MDTSLHGDRVEHLRLILDTANDAFIGIDEAGDIIDWNRQAEELFGWSCEEVEGRSLADLIIPAEYQEAHRRGLQRFIETGEGRVVFQRLELPAVHRSGHRLDVELTIWPSKMSGRWRFNAFLRDVTEVRRERAYVQLLADVTAVANASAVPEAAIRESIRKVAIAMDWPLGHAWLPDRDAPVLRPTGWWHRPDGEFDAFIAVTNETTFDEGRGLPGRVAASREPAWVVDVQHDSDFPRLQAAAQDGLHSAVAFPVLVGGRCVAVLEFYTRARYDVDERTSKLLASLGVQLGRVFERAEAIRESQSARSFKSRMLASLSHDLKTPAAAITGFSELLYDDWHGLDEETALQYVDAIRRQAIQLSDLLTELLTIEKLDAGELRHDVRVVDVARVLEPVIADLVGGEAEVSIPRGLTACVDAAHLVRMVTNLVTNARRYGAPPFTITATSSEDSVVISVEDRGPGVPAAVRERLFEPFVAGDPSGSGLGLSIVQGLAQLNGGRLDYEPAEPSGARFLLSLPAN